MNAQPETWKRKHRGGKKTRVLALKHQFWSVFFRWVREAAWLSKQLAEARAWTMLQSHCGLKPGVSLDMQAEETLVKAIAFMKANSL